jgi:hypothetical protein
MSLNKKKWSKTSSFLLPACGFDAAVLQEYGLKNAYLNDYKYIREEDDEDIDVFIVFSPNKAEEDFEGFCKVMRIHENFLDEYDVEVSGTHYVVFRVKLHDKWAHVKEELITSKYSEIDRNYVQKYFKPKVFSGRDVYGQPIYKDSTNWLILTKSPILKEQLEEALDVVIDEDLEVWEKLHSSEEIFRYE